MYIDSKCLQSSPRRGCLSSTSTSFASTLMKHHVGDIQHAYTVRTKICASSMKRNVCGSAVPSTILSRQTQESHSHCYTKKNSNFVFHGHIFRHVQRRTYCSFSSRFFPEPSFVAGSRRRTIVNVKKERHTQIATSRLDNATIGENVEEEILSTLNCSKIETHEIEKSIMANSMNLTDEKTKEQVEEIVDLIQKRLQIHLDTTHIFELLRDNKDYDLKRNPLLMFSKLDSLPANSLQESISCKKAPLENLFVNTKINTPLVSSRPIPSSESGKDDVTVESSVTNQERSDKNPIVIIISGPSGVGKDAVVKLLQKERKDLKFVVTATTRSKRVGEEDGVDYFFVSKTAFEQMLNEDELLEHAIVYGEYKVRFIKYLSMYFAFLLEDLRPSLPLT